MISAPDTVLLLGAGFVAGVVGTAGGITSLVSYPILLAIGLPALSANVTNIVALVACWPGSALASRPELRGRRAWLARWIPLAAAGGAAGAVLLLVTPSRAFAQVVPWLIVAGTLTLLGQPRMSARRAHVRTRARTSAGLPVGLAVLSIYNGYFGAGAGVMTLALLLLYVDEHLARANALKNMVIGAATITAAAILAVTGPVAWAAVLPLAIGMFLGSTAGPVVARRLSATALRWAIAALGFGLAAQLWTHRGS